jgi:hypothetical protein
VNVIGGLRSRLLHDSVQNTIEAGLAVLGWFDPGRSHRHIEFLTKPAEWDREITANSMVITARSRVTDWVELGSLLSQDMVVIGVDIYGESDSFVFHIANDIRDLMRGRLPVGPQRGSLPIMDYRMTTPMPIGHAAVTDVRATRVRPQVNRAYSLFWMGVDIELLDVYYSSDYHTPYPSLSLFPADSLFPGS